MGRVGVVAKCRECGHEWFHLLLNEAVCPKCGGQRE